VDARDQIVMEGERGGSQVGAPHEKPALIDDAELAVHEPASHTDRTGDRRRGRGALDGFRVVEEPHLEPLFPCAVGEEVQEIGSGGRVEVEVERMGGAQKRLLEEIF
jgi:hypothetical protein